MTDISKMKSEIVDDVDLDVLDYLDYLDDTNLALKRLAQM